MENKEIAVISRYNNRKMYCHAGFRNCGNHEIEDEYFFELFTDENVDIHFRDLTKAKSIRTLHEAVVHKMRYREKEKSVPKDKDLLNRVIRNGGFISYIKKLESTL